MTKIAFCFPGQGSVEAGMGREIAEAVPEAMEVYDRASEASGLDLRHLCFEGPVEELVETEVQQPALVTTSLAMLAALKARGFKPDVVIGHSVGEFSALAAVQAMPVHEAVALVRERGLAMAEAARKMPGSMAAILGLADEVVEAVCERIEHVWPANYNCPGQIVVSGANDVRRRGLRRGRGGGRAQDGQAQGLGRVPQPAGRDRGRAAAPGARARPLQEPDRAVHVDGDRAGRAGGAARRPARRPADGARALHAGGDRADPRGRPRLGRGRARQRAERFTEDGSTAA